MKTLSVLGVMAVSIISYLPAQAQYQPPPDQKQPDGYPTSSGTRGDNCVTIALLAPTSYVGRSLSSQPKLAWYVTNVTEPVQLQLSIYAQAGDGYRLVEKQSFQSKTGLMTATPHPLVKGTYFWQINAMCDEDSPSKNPVYRASVTVEESTLNRKEFKDLAVAGNWYDALEIALNNSSLTCSLLRDLAASKTEQSY